MLRSVDVMLPMYVSVKACKFVVPFAIRYPFLCKSILIENGEIVKGTMKVVTNITITLLA